MADDINPRAKNFKRKPSLFFSIGAWVLCSNFLLFFIAYFIAMTRAPEWADWVNRYILFYAVIPPYYFGKLFIEDNELCMLLGIPIATIIETVVLYCLAIILIKVFRKNTFVKLPRSRNLG